MAVGNKGTIYLVTALVLAFLVGLAILNGCKKQPGSVEAKSDSGQSAGASKDAVAAAKGLFGEPKTGLQNAINEAKTWGPVFDPWRGKIAPDFALTDIEGNVHKLSDYRGKNVLVVFWATSNGTSKMEVPGLVELRKAVPQEKLAIVAISREDPAQLKSFVAQNPVNYTVLSSAGAALVSPYADVQNVPSAFFIDSEGKIKLATMGLMPQADAVKILDAR